jgi:Copper transport outer membrane protein, MctB
VISFRFHVLAVTAVVIAVVAGLVLGALAGPGPVPAPAGASTAVADERRSKLQEQVDLLAERLSAGERMVSDLAPSLLAGRLATRRVIVVATPSAGQDVAGVEAMLTAGGAVLGGRVELTDRFTDPARRDELLDLAVRTLPLASLPPASLPPGVGTGLPGTGDGVVTTAALFGAVLLRRTPAGPDGDVRSVLSAYVSRGFLTGTSGVAGPADALVVLTGAAPAGGPDDAVVVLTAGLAQAGPVVAAGTGADAGTVLGRLRSDPLTAARLSTVDNVNTPQGKLATAWALADQLAGRIGHYGAAQGATGLLPPVAPPTTPPPASPTPDPSPSS